MRLLPTIAGAVMASSDHCRLGAPSTASGRRRGRRIGVAAVGLVGEAQQVGAFGVVELESAGERVQHAGRDTGEGAAFEFGVVLHAHAGQAGDLAAPQPGNPAVPDGGQAGPLGADLGAAGGEELAHFDSVVHDIDGTMPGGEMGCTASTPIDQ